MRMSDFFQILERIVGSGNVLTDDADKGRYEEDWRYDNGRALCVVRPVDTAQVSAVIKVCAERRVRLIPQGAATGLVGASVPDQSGVQIVLSLQRLNAVLDIDPVNKTALVGAGVTLSALNAKAAERGLFFPVDLGADPTIGGMAVSYTHLTLPTSDLV